MPWPCGETWSRAGKESVEEGSKGEAKQSGVRSDRRNGINTPVAAAGGVADRRDQRNTEALSDSTSAVAEAVIPHAEDVFRHRRIVKA